MREHRWSIEFPHAAERLWALMQDYDRWTEFAPMVIALVTDVVAAQAYTYKMISRQPGNDQSGRVQLEPLGPDKVRLHFEERFHIVGAPLRWFEGPIYRFINRKNEESMRRMSDWLTAHPEYRSDLVPSDEV